MSFRLSMVAEVPEQGDVKASPEANLVKDPKTDKMEPQTVTDGGITIDKSAAPAIKLDGPIGHMYTELLNKMLSVESMGAIVRAARDSQEIPPTEPGKVAMTPTGPIIEQADAHAGYIFVTKADDLTNDDFRPISDKLLAARRQNPDAPVGLAMLTDGKPSATMESLTNCLVGAGIEITYFEHGLNDMVKRMAKGSR